MDGPLDTRKYVSILKDLVEEGHEVSMTIVGSSMAPFLRHESDKIFFAAPDGPLKKGDMVFYQRANGRFVMHRIAKVQADSYYMVGDAQTEIEGPLNREQIFAKITKVERKGKMLTEGDFSWSFFQGPWLWVRPLRPLILKVYGWIRR